MAKRPHLLLAAAAGLLTLGAADGVESDPDAWELVEDAGGIRVWRQQFPDSAILGLRGEGTVEVPVARLLGLLMTTELGPEWVELMSESARLKEVAPGESIIYNRYDSPWPLQDRDLVLRRVVSIDHEARVVTSTYESVEDPVMPERECCVRGVSYYTLWRFTDVGGGRTRIELESFSDPKGSIPASVVNFFQRSWPRKSIGKLADRARGPDVLPYPPLASW